MKTFILTFFGIYFLFSISNAHSLQKLARQENASVITISNGSTPSLIASSPSVAVVAESGSPFVTPSAVVVEGDPPKEGNKPELVPTVVDTAPVLPPSTTPKPNATITEEEDDDSSEEEEDADENDAESDADAESDEESDDEESDDEEENSSRMLLKKSGLYSEEMLAYIPGYITEAGELLVPIDTVKRNLPYTIIPDFEQGTQRVKANRLNIPTNEHKIKHRQITAPTTTTISSDEEVDLPSDKIGTPSKNSIIFEHDPSSVESIESEPKPPSNPPSLATSPLSSVPSRAPTDEDDELDAIKQHQ